MVIVFEGPDASGKDVLRNVFMQRTSYAHTAVTRFGLSQLVYSAYFKRPLWTVPLQRRAYVDMLKKFTRVVKPLTVFTYATQDAVDARVKSRGEDPALQPSVMATYTLYKQVISMVGIPDKLLVMIDTTGDPPLTTLSEVVESRIRTLEGGHGK